MAEKFSCADFIEPDITFGVSVDLPYLLNIVTFDYSTCKCKLTLLDAHKHFIIHLLIPFRDCGCPSTDK